MKIFELYEIFVIGNLTIFYIHIANDINSIIAIDINPNTIYFITVCMSPIMEKHVSASQCTHLMVALPLF